MIVQHRVSVQLRSHIGLAKYSFSATNGFDTGRFPSLPPPLEFIKSGSIVQADGTPMHVAHLESGPYFIGERQLQQVSEWLEYPVCRGYRYNEALMLSGPLAAGKTTLMKLLPRLLAARCSQAAGAGSCPRPPVLFEFTFQDGVGPGAAALALERALERRTKELGLQVFSSDSGRSEYLALLRLDSNFKWFAERVHAAGGEPIFLLDEVQVRVFLVRSGCCITQAAGALQSCCDSAALR